MARYRLVAAVTVSAHTHVDAPSRERAIEIARELPVELDQYGRLNTKTLADDGEPRWSIEDADGNPHDILIEGVDGDEPARCLVHSELQPCWVCGDQSR